MLLQGETENGWLKESAHNGLTRFVYSATHTSSTSSNLTTGDLPNQIIHHLFNFQPILVLCSWSAGTKTTIVSLSAANHCTVTAEIHTLLSATARDDKCEGVIFNPKNLLTTDGALIETKIITPHMRILDTAGGGAGTNTVEIEIYLMNDTDTSIKDVTATPMGDFKSKGYTEKRNDGTEGSY